MKTFLLFAFSFLWLNYSSAQEAPAKANTIILTIADTSHIREKIIKVFTDKGYAIQKKVKNPNTIITEAKTLKNSRVSLQAEVKESEVIITGNIVVVAQGNMRIENKGNKGTMILNAWEEMDKVAKAFGVKLKYEVR